MVLIEKSKEPDSWTQHRKTPGSEYESTPELRDSLLKDQGFICAYCMRRIPVTDHGTTESSRIEHIIPQSMLTREQAMEYSNMVICCPGAISSISEKLTHCDRHKGEKPISLSPLDKNFIATLDYKRDGTLFSSDKRFDSEINTILNLNIEQLKANRKSVRNGLINFLNAKKNRWKRADLEKILQKYEGRDEGGRRMEYCGVVISYVSKKIRQLH